MIHGSDIVGRVSELYEIREAIINTSISPETDSGLQLPRQMLFVASSSPRLDYREMFAFVSAGKTLGTMAAEVLDNEIYS